MSSLKEQILLRDDLLSYTNETSVEGYVYINNYTTQQAKNNTTYIVGTMSCSGNIQFKVWSGATHNSMVENPVSNKICKIKGKVNEYNGSKSIVFDTCVPYEGTELEIDDFLEHKYDSEDLFKKLHKMIENNCTAEALSIFDTVISPIKDRFCKEFAASFHHDACAGGLVAHTFKTVKLVQIMKFYDTISEVVDKDLLFVAAALHDIGKVLEYNTGVVSSIGMQMSHLTLGVELLKPHEEYIVTKKGRDFYNGLLSVIQQHHGEYGERPRTLVAYLIHLVDGLEAQLTDINDAVESALTRQIKIEDYKLSF